jgi:DNA-binding response OmpR family regulator
LQDRFSSEGYEIETSNGDEELDELTKSLRKFQPDYLILDLILPKLDGFDVIKRTKEEELVSDSNVFIFTDLSDEDSRQRSQELGVDYYFVKNEFDINEFSEKVKTVIEDRDVEGDDDDLVME